MTIVIITHDMDVAEGCERVVEMSDGEIVLRKYNCVTDNGICYAVFFVLEKIQYKYNFSVIV